VRKVFILAILILSAFLAACGGGVGSGTATLDWRLLTLVYLLLFLSARAYLIAHHSRALAWAKMEGLWAEHVQGREEGQKQENQKKRDAQEDIEECLKKARDLLEGWSFLGRIGSLLLWNGEREMAAWVLIHRAERRAVVLMEDEEVRARLVRGLGELEAFPKEEREFWQKQLKCALGLEGQGQKEQGSLSGCQKLESKEQRALLEEFLAALYYARDTSYAQLLTLHNMAVWLLLVGLGLAMVLVYFAPGLLNGLCLGTGLLLGFLGGFLSRLLRVVATKELPTDYGAYWVPLFLAPVLGALGAVGGYLVFWSLVEAQVLGEGLKLLLSPPAAYGLFVVLGFSERLLEGLTKRLEGQVLKQDDQDRKQDGKDKKQDGKDKEKPEGG
jgi:hypothetical protein